MSIRFAPTLIVSLLVLVLAACGSGGPPAVSQSPAGSAVPTAGPTTTAAATITPAPTTVVTDEPSPTPASTAGAEVDFSRLATGETPDGWVEVLSSDGACRQAVPADWYIDTGIPGQALSSDLHAQALLANDGVTAFEEEIANLRATYFVEGQDVELETDELFLMREIGQGGKSYVLSLNAATTACGLLMTIDEVAGDQYAATGIQILYTLAETGV